MGRLLLSIYSFDIYCPRIDRKSICTPLSARIRQMTRGIPLSPRPENRKNMTAASAAKRRSPPAVPAIAEGAVEKERLCNFLREIHYGLSGDHIQLFQ